MLTVGAPQVVLAQPAPCAEGDGTAAMFSHAVESSRAPEPGWVVRVNIVENPGHRIATGELADATGRKVARRTFNTAGSACAPLARAIGLWTSMALDAKVAQTPPQEEPPKAPSAKIVTGPVPEQPKPAAAKSSAARSDPAVPVAAAEEPQPYPEQDLFLGHDSESRSLELGVSGFLMGNAGPGAFAGPSIFAVAELNGGFFLRPEVAYGRALEEPEAPGSLLPTWWASRVDGCGRMPGFYRERRGIQLDLCAGTEVGVFQVDRVGTDASQTIPFFAIGPALGLRGELGGNLSAQVRGTGLWEVVRASYVDGAGQDRTLRPFAGRIELALGWRLQ